MHFPNTKLLTASIVLALAAPAAFARDACFQTTRLMRSSCNLEIQEELKEAQAVCENLSDTEEAIECKREARADKLDAFGECTVVAAARDDVCLALGDTGPYDPDLDPANFVSPDEAAANPNPYWPLIPGHTWVYDDGEELITVTVTDETREIDDVETIVVRDIVVDEDGDLVESTDDYYAQDHEGNVWYFGETSQNFEDGFLTDLEGSFYSGEDGAKAGVLFFADPQLGPAYRQEFFLGDAEDIAEVVALNVDESSEFTDCDGTCVQTLEYTPLEPDSMEFKFYKPGVGLILETKPDEDERLELIDFIPGS